MTAVYILVHVDGNLTRLCVQGVSRADDLFLVVARENVRAFILRAARMHVFDRMGDEPFFLSVSGDGDPVFTVLPSDQLRGDPLFQGRLCNDPHVITVDADPFGIRSALWGDARIAARFTVTAK